MAVNFNNTTPAAPANNTNVQWQQDVSGNISGYVPSSAQKVASVDLTAQVANIAASTLVTPAASALYKVSAYIVVTQAATTSSTLPSIVLTWTDQDNNTSESLTLTPTNTGNALTTYQQAVALLSVKNATNLQYSTTGYLSSGATGMQYAIHIRVEQI